MTKLPPLNTWDRAVLRNLVVAQESGPSPYADIGHELLGKYTGLTSRQIGASVEYLEHGGYIVVERDTTPHRRRPNRYHVLFDGQKRPMPRELRAVQ